MIISIEGPEVPTEDFIDRVVDSYALKIRRVQKLVYYKSKRDNSKH